MWDSRTIQKMTTLELAVGQTQVVFDELGNSGVGISGLVCVDDFVTAASGGN